jgi:hypothetical protein
VSSVSKLPNVFAVYVLYGGKDPAYVGVTDKLRNRVEQHLVKRDSSVATQTSAVCLNPDCVTEVRWWEHTLFASRDQLEAAELVAFSFFEPVYRGRGNPSKRAAELSGEDEFQAEMKRLFSGEATGQLTILTLQDALSRIDKLEERVKALEKRR